MINLITQQTPHFAVTYILYPSIEKGSAASVRSFLSNKSDNKARKQGSGKSFLIDLFILNLELKKRGKKQQMDEYVNKDT